jgi:hypothetical protein
MRTVQTGVLICVAAALVGGCNNNRAAKVADTKGALAGNDFSVNEKSELVKRIAGDTTGTAEDRRERLKSIAWQATNGYRVRNQAIDVLAADTSDPDSRDTRNMLNLMLGVEPDRGVVEHVCELAAQRGWTDLTPAIVRMWSRRLVTVKDDERAEKAALEKLYPGRPVEATVYEVFTMPEAPGGGSASERTEKARAAAWEVLTRIDPDGSKRKTLVAQSTTGGGPAMADLQAATREMGVVPMSAPELAWLRQLRLPANSAWWAETRGVVQGLDAGRKQGLGMRHLEALRWAARFRPQWMGTDRAGLAAQVTDRLKGRDIHIRSEQGGDSGKGSERFKDNVKRMSWADLICVLVVDEAVHGANAPELWQQAKQDQGDTTTEYGGTLTAGSSEMISNGPTALVQYHFHAQKDSNDEFAGPSGGDLEYARDSGRLCVVFTPVKTGVFDADLYFGDGIRTDLGTIMAGTK